MPLYKTIKLSASTSIYFWKITEDFNTLFSQVQLKDASLTRLKKMKAESHQKGFLAVRMLLQHINFSDFNLLYDDFGKPSLNWEVVNYEKEEENNVKTQKKLHISISHSHEFSAIAISNHTIGLDIEILKEKILKIAPRYMTTSHLESLTKIEKIKKATVVWGIKESIFKIKNHSGISFLDHIFEDHFLFEDKKTFAKLIINNREERFKIVFDSIEEYIFVCAFEN